MFLPGLPVELIKACYAAAPANEIASGKFDNRRSSAALSANTFGLYLAQPHAMPPLPGDDAADWPVRQVQLEASLRFPWPGGRLPCLDVLITTRQRVIGIESKRFEPFRPSRAAKLSEAYRRPLWGDSMGGYERVRDGVSEQLDPYRYLDATELVRLAFGLRTSVHRDARRRGLRPLLVYLYAEPSQAPDGRTIPADAHAAHRQEIDRFTQEVAGAEVGFRAIPYQELLTAWMAAGDPEAAVHAAAVARLFAP